MHTGTLINDLFAAVERAEESGRARRLTATSGTRAVEEPDVCDCGTIKGRRVPAGAWSERG